jgi:hypothetical protein
LCHATVSIACRDAQLWWQEQGFDDATTFELPVALFGAQMAALLFAYWQIGVVTHLPSVGKTAW